MLSKEQIQVINSVLDSNGKIENAWIFGSFARNEETEESDIDIAFSFKDGKSFGYLEMFGLVDELESRLKRPVDFIKKDAILPFAADSVEHEKVLIYGNQ